MTLTYTHLRSSWVTTRPVSGPAFNWDLIDFVVIHWPGHDGVPDGDIDDRTDLAAYIRNTHHGYLDNPKRGYSLGYSAMVDYLGGSWEVRGDTYRAASNAPQAFNQRTFSINYMTDLGGHATDEGIDGVNRLITQVRARRPDVIVMPHRDGPLWVPGATPTQCCGDSITNLIRTGVIGAEPSQEDDDMTPEDRTSLRKIEAQVQRLSEAVFVDNSVYPGYPSMFNMFAQVRTWIHLVAKKLGLDTK